MLPMLWWIVSAALARPAFFPGPGPATVEVDADGRVGGLARTGLVLVRTEDPEALARVPGVGSVERLRGAVVRVTPAPGTDDVALAASLHGLPGIGWAHPDLVLPLVPASLPDDPYLGSEWHIQNTGQLGFTPGVDIGASDAWEVTRGAGQLVAIVDTGVDLLHPDLSVIPGHDYVGHDEDPSPDDPHGTACAGLAAGVGDNAVGTAGVAWEADAYAIRLVGGTTTTADMYDALVEAVDAGAGVLSNSWGFEDPCAPINDYGAFDEAVDYAERHGRGGLGAAVVFAAGNGACDIAANNWLADERVITVAAVNGYDEREWYSCFGDAVDVAGPSGAMVTTDMLGSAGYNGYPGDDGYTNGFNGTSAATPVVAGVVALMFAANERLTAAQARDALCDTSVPVDLASGTWDATGRSPWYGCGRVDAAAAVRAVSDLGPPTIPVPTADSGWSAVLAFTSSDPDGASLEYDVRWAFASDPWPRTTVHADQPWVDLSADVHPGDTIVWQVRAQDRWGVTDWSEDRTFTVAAPILGVLAPPPGGCDTGGGGGAVGVALAILATRRRRRG